MNILNEILTQADKNPHAVAIIQLQKTADNGYFQQSISCTYQTLIQEAQQLTAHLDTLSEKGAQIGVVMGNTPEWVLADIALLLAERVEVPVPLAFSGEQAAFLLHNCQTVLTDAMGAKRLAQWQADGLLLSASPLGVELGKMPPHAHPVRYQPKSGMQDAIIKVLHTSGTTSQPKGVRIRRHGLDALVAALWQCARPDDYQRYLNLVPLSLLIEQVTALYMPLTSGGTVIMPPADLPPLGSPGVTAVERLSLIRQTRPSAMTLTPALVEALAERARQHGNGPNLLQALFGRETVPLLAAGGAPVSAELLHQLDAQGIPVYQGYGLSENSSVAAWNSRGANRIGTVRKPLAHVEVKIAEDGELCLRSSSLFAGYSSEDPSSCAIDQSGWLHTGDLATQDQDGFISIIGRKKTMIITANGRNISPEWLESAYRSVPGVVQAIVYGDKQQFLSGIFIVNDMAQAHAIRRAIATYAREHLNEIEIIPDPVLIPYSPEVMARLFTVTGRPRRNDVPSFLAQYETVTV
ncbi:AMP-dependent synthetase [Pantoea alhagi]|uniref:AMP-dependent synthetase n=1 Tax=Pantoea alhagi TaxID=1891675 RepID=A0A1W6B1S0_9GAMM|nr:AMP-binding protein [Pantoea alhagi]ARJ41016.1 AMP-dependent synthetase [Pantoea alhagi]